MRSLLGTVIWVVGFSLSSLLVCPAIPFWPEEFLLKDQLLSLWGSPCRLFVVFFLAAFNICSLCLISIYLINMCLGVFRLGFILFGTLWVSWTWVAISFPILGKFLTIIFSSIFSCPFILSFYSQTPMIWMLWHLTLSQRSLRFSSFLFILFSFFFPCLLHLFPPFCLPPNLSCLLPQLLHSWFPPECFWSHLLHYSLLIDSFLFLLGLC